MSKKRKIINQPQPVASAEVQSAVLPSFNSFFNTWKFRFLAGIVFILAFGIYFNTIGNGYALDDGIVITENTFTKKGFAGIKEIFSQETFANVTNTDTELSGGRYRPLSVASFAIEYQFFGLNPSISHFVNVLLYGFLCVLLLYLFDKYIFKNNRPAAIIAALIFVVHPLHTDVVSNIKGRDEILCLLLLLGSLILYFKFLQQKNYWLLVASLAAYFVSLLAKENGVTFLAVIPLMLYFFLQKNIKKSLTSILPFLVVFAIYFFIRLSIVGLPQSSTQEVMNAPFVKATASEALATKIMILGKDLWMLIFPHPLSFDYSYNQIPYVNFSNWKCLLAISINTILILIAILLFKKKHVVSFAILFYFITLSIITNIVFEVGSPFNERFLFQPSIGFCIAVAYLLSIAGFRDSSKKAATVLSVSFALLLILAGSMMTIVRNTEWKNNETLFAADALHSPNSAKTNNFYAITLLKKGEEEKDSIKKNEIFNSAVMFLNKSLAIYPDFADAYINLGNIYAQQGKLDMAKEKLLKAKAIYPTNSVLNINLTYVAQKYEANAVKYFAEKRVTEAIKAANSSLECYPNNVSMLYNLGGYYLTLQDVVKAKEIWSKALVIDPGNATVKMWLERISSPQLPKN